MVSSDPSEALLLAHERLRRLRQEAAALRLRRPRRARRALADSLRRAADRLDPATLAHSSV
jgi:hypothetical protein